jgi:hypothetical protein
VSYVKRGFPTLVLALMLATSGMALFDLYLFASSGLH